MSTFNVKWILELTDRITAPLKAANKTVSDATANFTKLTKEIKDIRSAGGSINDLQARIEKLKNLRDVSNSVSAVKRLNAEIAQTERQLGKMENAGRGAFGAIGQQLSQVIPGFSLLTNPLTIAVGGLALATNSAMNFERGMAEVNSTLQISKPQLTKLSDELLELGRNSTVDINRIPTAFNKIVSAGYDAKQAMDILKPSLKAAQAGFTDIEEVTTAAAAVMANVPDATPTRAFDVMFAAVNAGSVTFKNLAAEMPKVLPIAKSLGLQFEEMAAQYAFYTKQGISAENATTLITNTFTALKTHAGDIESIGVKIFDDKGNMRPMLAMVKDLSERFKGLSTAQKMALLASTKMDAQASQAFITMVGKVGELESITKNVTAATNNGMGQLEATLAATGNSIDIATKVKNQFSATLIKLGQVVLPFASVALDKLNAALDWLYTHGKPLLPWIVGITAGFVTFKLATMAVSAAFAVFNAIVMANPISLAIAAIAALTAGVIYCYHQFDTFRNIVDGVWGFIKGFAGSIIDLFSGVVSGIGQVIEGIKNGDWSGAAKGAFNALKNSFMLSGGLPISMYVAGAKGVQGAVEGYRNSSLADRMKNNLTEADFDKLKPKTPNVPKSTLTESLEAQKLLNDRLGSGTGDFFQTAAEKKAAKKAAKGGGAVDKLDSGGGGNGKIINITFNVQNLNGIQNLTVEKFAESLPNVERAVTEVIVRAFADAEILASR